MFNSSLFRFKSINQIYTSKFNIYALYHKNQTEIKPIQIEPALFRLRFGSTGSIAHSYNVIRKCLPFRKLWWELSWPINDPQAMQRGDTISHVPVASLKLSVKHRMKLERPHRVTRTMVMARLTWSQTPWFVKMGDSSWNARTVPVGSRFARWAVLANVWLIARCTRVFFSKTSSRSKRASLCSQIKLSASRTRISMSQKTGCNDGIFYFYFVLMFGVLVVLSGWLVLIYGEGVEWMSGYGN